MYEMANLPQGPRRERRGRGGGAGRGRGYSAVAATISAMTSQRSVLAS